VNVFAEDTYTKVESIDGQDIRVKIMDTCDNVSFAKKLTVLVCCDDHFVQHFSLDLVK